MKDKELKQLILKARAMSLNELQEVLDILVGIYEDKGLRYLEGYKDKKN